MKRSEMIENIASELIHEHANFPQWHKAIELAIIILNRIEEDGMLPPTINVLRNDYYSKGHNVEIFSNVWELENE